MVMRMVIIGGRLCAHQNNDNNHTTEPNRTKFLFVATGLCWLMWRSRWDYLMSLKEVEIRSFLMISFEL